MAGLAACEGAAEGTVQCPPARPAPASPPGDRARRHPGVTRHTRGQHTRRRRTRGQQARGPAVPRQSSCRSPRKSRTRACQRGAEPPEPPPRWLCSQEHAVTRPQSCGRPHAPALGRPTPPGSAATALQTPAGCPHSRARLRPRGRLSGPGAQRQARSLARRPGLLPRRPSRLACAPQLSAPWPASVAPRTPLRCAYRQCGQASARKACHAGRVAQFESARRLRHFVSQHAREDVYRASGHVSPAPPPPGLRCCRPQLCLAPRGHPHTAAPPPPH